MTLRILRGVIKNNVLFVLNVFTVSYFHRPDEILTNSSKSLESLRILLAEVNIKSSTH